MKTALTIYLGNDSAFAAVDVNGQISLLALSESEAGLPLKKSLGDIDLYNPERKFPDEDLIQIELFLADLFSKVIARCIRVIDIYPDEVLLVVSEDISNLDTHLSAARRAQIKDMTIIEENRSLAALASYGPKGVSADYAPVIGGLFWARHGDSLTGPLPIVTREDLGATEKVVSKPPVAPSAPSVLSLGDRSVFEPQVSRGKKTSINFSWLITILILCTGLASVYYFVFSDSQQSSQKELETAVIPVTSVPVTSVPVATGNEEVIEAESPELGVVTLAENGLLLLAGTATQLLLSFESPQEAVMSSLTSFLGQPNEEEVAAVDEICNSTDLQVFKFDALEVVFKSYDMGPIFSLWFVSGEEANETNLWTLGRIGLGSSVAELKQLPQSQILIEEVFPGTNDPAGKFQIDPFGLGMLINGLTSNTNEQGRILEMWAGEGCQRLPEG